MNNFFFFCYSFFHTYDITTEVVMLLLIFILHSIIRYSKPEKTYMMKIFYAGLISAYLSIIFHIALLASTIAMRKTNNVIPFNIFYVLYSISYVLVLDFILVYQTQLSYKRRSQKKYIALMCIICSAVWQAIMLYPLLSKKLLDYENGMYLMSFYSDLYVLCSFICSVLALIITIINRKDVSRIVYYGSFIFIPIDTAATLIQLYFHTAYFICATYTLPFLIYFILFHTNKYDDVTGTQGYVPYRTHLSRVIKRQKNFLHLSVSAPKLEVTEFSETDDTIVYIYNYLSRTIEKVDRRVRVYGMTTFDYNIVCEVNNMDEYENIKNRLINIFTTPVFKDGFEYKIYTNILVSKSYEQIKNVDELLILHRLKKRTFQNLDKTEIIEITEDDVRKFSRRSIIEKNLKEIEASNNLDDERVVLYIQPIYKIAEDDFRTGESLMRLRIDGEMFFPDEFIPVAEEIGCIHTFTKIILNKVAKLTVYMREHCDFDALTVNVSTIEMTDSKVCDEFMGIIKAAGASPENIRLEITESTSITDYSTIISNVKKLNEMGISFYLDDFGTGYSNLDRVISMPFKTIKFDKSLLYKALEDKKTEELFVLLSTFCKANGFATVIEGVENERQKDFVAIAGFDYIQGYLYSKPLPAEESLKYFG